MLIIFNFQLIQTIRILWFCHRSQGQWNLLLRYSLQEAGRHSNTLWLDIGSSEQGAVVALVLHLGGWLPLDTVKGGDALLDQYTYWTYHSAGHGESAYLALGLSFAIIVLGWQVRCLIYHAGPTLHQL
jgi:hypothetical protein